MKSMNVTVARYLVRKRTGVQRKMSYILYDGDIGDIGDAWKYF